MMDNYIPKMRLKCNLCGKEVSGEVPEGTKVLAHIECPECLDRKNRKKTIILGTGNSGPSMEPPPDEPPVETLWRKILEKSKDNPIVRIALINGKLVDMDREEMVMALVLVLIDQHDKLMQDYLKICFNVGTLKKQ